MPAPRICERYKIVRSGVQVHTQPIHLSVDEDEAEIGRQLSDSGSDVIGNTLVTEKAVRSITEQLCAIAREHDRLNRLHSGGHEESLLPLWTPSGDSLEAYISIPKRINRKDRSRGWKRLTVIPVTSRGNDEDTRMSGEADATNKRAVSAWIIPSRSVMNEGDEHTIVIAEVPKLADFMASIPDETPWQDMAVLGTHDSCAFYGCECDLLCQQPATPVFQQLLDGVRYLDFRMRVIDDELIMYHGIRTQRATFLSALAQIHQFLSEHPTESILLSLKEEVPPLHPRFSALLWEALEPHIEKFWFLEERLPTIGEVRGKGMMMLRFPIAEQGWGWDRGRGIDPPSWPDNRKEGFEFTFGDDRGDAKTQRGGTVRVQDWYGVPSFLEIPEKLEAVINHLEPTVLPAAHSHAIDIHRPLTLSYLSAASFPLAPPMLLAKGFGWPEYGFGIEGLNSRLTRWLLEKISRGEKIRAVVPCDFYRQAGDLCALLIAMNSMDDGQQRR